MSQEQTPEDREKFLQSTERSISHWVGHASALEEAAKEAKSMAGEFFAAKKDELASIWREVGDWLEDKAKKGRRKQLDYSQQLVTFRNT